MTKHELREALEETRRREAELVTMCTDAPPDRSGKWHPKDHLAHIAYFRERDAVLIDAVRSGGEIPPKSPEGHSDIVHVEYRERPAAEVIAMAHSSWDHFLAAIDACSEEDLARPRPHDPERKLIDGSPGDHLAAHLMWVHLDAGDEPAAEAAVRWAWELSKRTTSDSRSLGVGAYNVACFYARTRRVDAALPLLRQGFDAVPDLKEWARKDPDLDPIRDDPRVADLLGASAVGERHTD